MTSVEVSKALPEYITREEFSSFAKILTSRVEAEEKLGDLRMSKIVEVQNENITEINLAIKLLSDQTQNGLAMMNERLNNTNDRLNRMERDVLDIRKEMTSMKDDINGVKSRIAEISGELTVLAERQTHMEQTFTERQTHMEQTFTERQIHMEQAFSEKLDHAIDTLTIAISGNEKRLEDFREELQVEQDKSLTKLGIRVALFVGAVQVAVSIALHFLG